MTSRRLAAFVGSLLSVAMAWPLVSPAPVSAADPVEPLGEFFGRVATDFPDASTPGPRSAAIRAAALTPPGFTDTVALSGLATPIMVRFAADGRVFVAEKSGIIKVFDNLADQTPTVFADLRTNVHDFWDRGLLGMALDPAFPSNPYVYVLYALDGGMGASVPRWNDTCPNPPGATTDGCLIAGRLSRLTASGNVASGPEQVLIQDWCQQYPSHSLGDLQFGADGALYVSAGDGANFLNVDYGQFGGTSGSPVPKNPCGDPPTGSGGNQTVPTARGGALRAQSPRRPAGDPIALDGSILRVDPATGNGLPDNPMAASADANLRRVVAFGGRNPFRFAIRPSTNELWIGDVGWNDVDEINRVADPLTSTVANLGWPCFEGNAQQQGYASTGLDQCASLYTNPTGLMLPYYAYAHDAQVVPGEACPSGSSALAGLAFYQGGPYPAAYDGALFFADHARKCVWAMRRGSNGLPDPSQIETLVSDAGNPVDLEIGPNGDLFYVDFDGGAIHRIAYGVGNQAPTAVITANPASGPSPLLVALDGRDSTDPEGEPLTYAWDLDNDGSYDDSTSPTPSHTFATSGTHVVGLRVVDVGGLPGTTTFNVLVDDALPAPVIDTPSPALAWTVGQNISFSGHATDGQGAAIPASGLSWSLLLQHCPSNCHAHTVQSWSGVAGASFFAPDHDYPSYLELVLTATDSAARQSTVKIRLDPQTVDLTFRTTPTGLSLAVGTSSETATPFTRRVIVGSALVISAPSPQSVGTTSYAFSSWSDGGGASHTILAPPSPTTYTATYAAGGSTSYLSDLAYSVVSNGWGPVEKDRSNGEQGAGDGLPLTLNGVVSAKGLGTHAASDIRYTMSGCTLFSAKIGVDDEVGSFGSVIFQVFTDGTKVYESAVLTGASASPTINVDVTNKTSLQLVVTNGGDNVNYDHGDWADARLTCAGPPGGTPLFSAPTSFPAGNETHGVSLVDINADAKLDIVAANAGSSTASIWLGNGNGTFGARADFATGTTPKQLSLGDLNGDGNLDLVSANQDAASVSVLLGNGAGSFGTKIDYAACTGTHETALGDLNADGKLDVIAACWGGSVVSVLLGNGNGTLQAKVDRAVGSAPHSVVLGLFNGDAHLDAAVANHSSGSVSILIGIGNGTFQTQVPYSVGTGPHSLRAGDVNGDGRPDLAAVNDGSSNVSILLGNANGTFAPAVNYQTGSVPKGVAIADVSGDGRLDVLTANTAGSYPTCCQPGGDTISVLLGSATGALSAATTYLVGQTPFAVTAGDIDADGDLDVATANWHSDNVTIVRNQSTSGGGDTTPPTVTGTVPTSGASGVAASIVPSATFSEAIDPATINATNLTLTNQATSGAVSGSVAYDAGTRTASFTPGAALTASTSYLARVKGGASGVKDLAGNPLATDVTWTFTVAAAGGSTSYLSDLAYSVVSNGWGPVEKDRSNGEQGAGDGLPLTLNGVVSAKGLGTHAASDIRYTMSGCTLFSAKIGVDDEVGSFGSVIFQVFTDGTKVYESAVLTGASASPTINVDVTNKTSLQLVVTNGGDNVNYDHGDWADAQLTCAGPPPDTTPPTVTGTVPTSGASGVAASIVPSATFSEAIDPATINATNLTLTNQATSGAVSGSVAYDAGTRTASFTPGAALTASTSYLARVKGGASGVKDLAGNPLATDVTWTFTVAAAGGSTSYLSDLAYSVVSNGWGPVEKDRSNGEQGAGDGLPLTLNGVVSAKGLGTHAASDIRYTMSGCTLFSAKIGVDDEVGSFGSVIFQVFTDGTKVYESAVLTGASASPTINVDVTNKTSLQLVVTNGGDNVNYDHGDWADAQLTCAGPPPDTTPPTVTGTVPTSGASGVAASIVPSATFSEAIDPATINATNLTLTNQATSGAVSGSVAYNAGTRTASFTPGAALTASTSYLARVKGGASGVKDLAGNPLAADVTWTFTVAAAGGSTSYLSDLAYSVVSNGWGPVEKDRSNGEQGAGDGLPLTLNGVVSAKGLGTHAASDIRYTMSGCTLFSAKIGVDDEVGSFGSVIFQVFTDGTKVYESAVLTGASASPTINVDVTNKTSLQLVVTNGGDNVNYDHGDWADAQLTCGS